jgi:hypothetical protein
LYKLASGAVSDLGYEEFIGAMDATKLAIIYDAGNNEWHIEDGTISYIATEHGLSRSMVKHSSVTTHKGVTYYVGASLAYPYRYIATGTFDMGLPGHKQISSVELECEGDDIEVAVATRFRLVDVHTIQRWKKLNKDGVVSPMASGNDFQLHIRSPYDMTLTGLAVRYKYDDKRYVRGLYVTDKNAETTAT